MSETADSITSTETQHPPSYDVSSESSSQPHSYQEQQPPPCSADPATDPPPKDGTVTDTPRFTTENKSSSDINPQAYSVTAQPEAQSSFEDATVRRGFVRKVFCLVILMLLFSFAVVSVFSFSDVVIKAVHQYKWIYPSATSIFLVVVITVSCNQSRSRRHPWNIVGLVVVILSFSCMLGGLAAYTNSLAVLLSTGATTTICIAITAFSIQTRFDFTLGRGFLLILAVDVIMLGIFCTFYYSHAGDVALGCLGSLVFSLCLLVNIQLMTGEMHNRLNPEEYATAALFLYTDIIVMFVYLIALLFKCVS
ncbi:protein lifeguard 1-like isoform X2 [Cheilinus undulatus]|nr:protein lifeguard 1-like isoform X2 [Cheilinus undulatus]